MIAMHFKRMATTDRSPHHNRLGTLEPATTPVASSPPTPLAQGELKPRPGTLLPRIARRRSTKLSALAASIEVAR